MNRKENIQCGLIFSFPNLPLFFQKFFIALAIHSFMNCLCNKKNNKKIYTSQNSSNLLRAHTRQGTQFSMRQMLQLKVVLYGIKSETPRHVALLQRTRSASPSDIESSERCKYISNSDSERTY